MIRTRFAPSPTGLLHLGNIRAALFSALYAKHCNGKFVLRIEDTDATRSEHEYAVILQDDLKWLGIEWQEGPGVEGPNGPYWQSKRAAIYDNYYKILEERHLAYPCFCSDQELAINRKLQLSRGLPPRYPGTCRQLSKEEISKRFAEGKKAALRFQVPEKTVIEFTDLVKGPQRFNAQDIGDFIIRRAEGTASFMFCNAIDDSLMGITHILRGEDHLANTPRQLMILDVLQLTKPQYGHLSLITGDDGAPLSKRHGSFSLHDLRNEGFLAQAVLNYLSRLGHTCDEQQLMTFSELADHFRIEKLSRSAARFDRHQLLHWQKEALMTLNYTAVWKWLGKDLQQLVPANLHVSFVETVRANINFPNEALHWLAVISAADLPYTEPQLAILKNSGYEFFSVFKNAVDNHGDDLSSIFAMMKDRLNVSGKNLFLPVRVALTAEDHGPELLQVVKLLGKEKMQQRLDSVLKLVG